MRNIDLKLDVSGAAGLGENAFIAATVFLPPVEALAQVPVVCFAKPGGGFSRHYYSEDLPGSSGHGSQADWHRERGWIFVCLDHLGVGESSTHHDPQRLDYSVVTAANHAAEQEILRQLHTGELCRDFPAVENPLLIGMGQSMGGSLTVVQQGRYHCYDSIAVLGYSAVHTHPAAPGAPAIVFPWCVRDPLPAGVPAILNPHAMGDMSRAHMTEVNRKLFFHDDLDKQLVDQLVAHPAPGEQGFPWRSSTMPLGVVSRCLTPGVIAQEAAAVTVPVLVAMGERDVIADPKGEPRAYLSATSVDLFICPKMGHMHNFATTRELLWQRIHTWGEWVRYARRGSTFDEQ